MKKKFFPQKHKIDVPLHPPERLKCKKRIKQEPEIQYVEIVLQYPRDQLRGRLKNKPANIICDE